MEGVRGKVAFVTGGVSGIGLGIAKALIHEGAVVAVSYMRESHRDAAMAEMRAIPGANARAFKLDVTDRAAMRDVADRIERELGPVDLLCNNAGANLFGPLEDATHDDWDWILDVNLGGTINGIVTFLPRMRHRGSGYIVNVGSMASFISGPRAGVYTTSKAGVRGLTECLRYALAQYGIGVSLLCPGLTNSNIHESGANRPQKYHNSGYVVTRDDVDHVKSVLNIGMSADEVGRKTVDAVKEGKFYIFTHPEFREELEEMFANILEGFPTEDPEPRRYAFELSRRERYRRALSGGA